MHTLGGWRTRQYRQRWLALTSLFVGLLTILGCYCLPSSFLLLCWGAFVLFHEDVVQRFEVSGS